MEHFNHHMMTLARYSRELTQADLARRLSVSQGTLSKYETGLSEPPAEFVSELASSLGYTPKFFYENGRPYGFSPFHYRKRKKLSSKTLDRIVAEINIRRMHVQKLSLSFDLQTNGAIPEIDLDEYHGRGKKRLLIEDVARQVREKWMLPQGPISNLIELLEANGGLVIPCDFGTNLIDAVSQRIDGMPVLFFINVNAPSDRLRHTLAHELAHMVLHTITLADEEQMEEEADDFAGAFLLPAEEIKTQLRRFDLRHLANMKGYWKVSMAAIAMRADKLNLITSYQKKMFFLEMNKLGYRKREPNEPHREQANLLRQMIAFHIKKLGYTATELADLLHLTVAEFQRMYSPEFVGKSFPHSARKHLRIVK